MMKILVTGMCGNVGSTLTLRLVGEGHEVRGLDLATEANKEAASHLGRRDIVWGDITNLKTAKEAITNDLDAVVHLAFMLPPMSEDKPELSQRVNVGGTANIINEINATSKKPKLIFTSSVTVYGITASEKPPVKPDHLVVSTDNYTRHKIECEEMIRESKAKYTILRLAAAPPLDPKPETMGLIHLLHPSGRTEFLHVEDACTAIINSIKLRETDNRTFLIAGGKRNQMLYKDLITKTFSVFGLPKPDCSEFSKKPYYTDWYDTNESQAVLKYQERTLDDYINEIKERMGM
jgi:nucleoside-diphosphate-sugar epimerase